MGRRYLCFPGRRMRIPFIEQPRVEFDYMGCTRERRGRKGRAQGLKGLNFVLVTAGS